MGNQSRYKTHNRPCVQIIGPCTASRDPWPCQGLHTQGLSLNAVLEGHGLLEPHSRRADPGGSGLTHGWRMVECGPEFKGV